MRVMPCFYSINEKLESDISKDKSVLHSVQ